MAINKKLIHFKTKLKFLEELAKGNILNTSIVFILDTTEIYTHGQLYDGSTFDPTNIEISKQDVISDLEEIRSGAALGATALQVEQYTGTYSKPTDGIPKTDLANAVQTSLNNADTALQEEQYKGTVATKDADIVVDELWSDSFETLPNGNIKLTVNGISKEFMSATPSGDPMHDIYVNVGAEYNNTGEDIVRTSIYGDSVVWKNAYWWLNDLGDITNDEMRDIYIHANITQAAKTVTNMLQGITTRTNIATWTGTWSSKLADTQMFGYCSNLKTARLRNSEHYTNANATWMFAACANLEKIFPTLNATSTTNFNGAFDSCASLKEIRLKALGVNCSFATAQNLSNASILYMIDNSNASKTITITLHANAYDRAMADSNIVSALNGHSNVTLAKA